MRRLYRDLVVLFLDAVALQQSVDGWLLATETFVEGHCRLGVATHKNILLERLSGCRVEDACLLEVCECVCVKNLRPLVAVVASCVATREDVGEGLATACARDLWSD